MTIAAVVLAGGAGTRFGDRVGAKLLAPFRGRPVIAWAVDAALSAGFDETLVVAGAVDAATLASVVPDGVRVVDNPDWADGQATSLAAAVATATDAGHDAIVVALGDQPLVEVEAWRRVGAAVDTPIAVAVYDGTRGHPVRLGRDVWPLLPTAGDRGAGPLIAEHPSLVGEVPCPGRPVDIDTVEDLERWS
jgi:molybdenum cofactor cytidylyltransferase